MQTSCSHVFGISYHISNLMFTYVWSSLIVTDCAFPGCFQQCSDSRTIATVSKPAVCVSVCPIGRHSSGQVTWPQPQPVLSAIIQSTVWKAVTGQRKSGLVPQHPYYSTDTWWTCAVLQLNAQMMRHGTVLDVLFSTHCASNPLQRE